ncbi:hypothetical protein F5B22DRAFT_624343 [Xylaria bambusicola]|uniref:uncharacterized protein n=1 Tax=Xylaria bambusicola TaxID=326684 RepID=UPI002007CAE5|nr:uncharacterized protein F5B22DRAFT_624343 [Xylaria bambusicola]KAI0506296.1 hypothetical protein F5B22DRAFT_624343 [Xylaria bambusicola]
MSLFWVSDPAIPRKSVKAHVAKNTHARARRERTAKYQARRYRSASEQQSFARSHPRHEQQNQFTCITPADSTFSLHAYHDPGVETGGSGSLAVIPSSTLDSEIFTQSHFGGLHNPMSPFECSLVKYYVEVVVSLNGDLTGTSSPLQSYKATVLFDWLPVALSNPVMTMGFYLCSCRSLYARTGVTRYYQLALQYKAACLRLLVESIAATCTSNEPVISDIILSTVLQLASDELIAGDLGAWGKHVDAINEIVRLSGGLDKIQGMKGLLRKLIEVLSSENVLRLVQCSSLQNNDTMACIALEALLR